MMILSFIRLSTERIFETHRGFMGIVTNFPNHEFDVAIISRSSKRPLTVNSTKMTKNTIISQSFTILNTECCTNSAILTLDDLENLQLFFLVFDFIKTYHPGRRLSSKGFDKWQMTDAVTMHFGVIRCVRFHLTANATKMESFNILSIPTLFATKIIDFNKTRTFFTFWSVLY